MTDFEGLGLYEIAALNTPEALDYFWRNVDHDAYFDASRLAFFDTVADFVVSLGRTPRAICDLGCGPGYALAALNKRYPKATVTGVDYAQSAVDLCRELLLSDVAMLRDIRATGLPNGAFDLTLCLQTLEHIRDYPEVLFEMARITRPGGDMIITVPNGATDTYAAHVNFWTIDDMAGLLKPYGLVHQRFIRDGAVILNHCVKR